MLVNAVVLISGGQAVRTPRLNQNQDLANALKWDPKKTQVLLNSLRFINDDRLIQENIYQISLEKVSRSVFPFGWLMVAPLVVSGIETLAMMSKDEVGQSSYINPHGDLDWVGFGLQDIDLYA
jgi:hypothetical protein